MGGAAAARLPCAMPTKTPKVRLSTTRASSAKAATSQSAAASRAAAPKPQRSRLTLAEAGAAKPSRNPPTSNINQWGYFAGVEPINGWSVDLVSQALTTLRQGQFSLAGVLADDMAASPFISHCLEILDEFFTTTPCQVVPAARGEARRCADMWREVLPDVLPLSVLKDLHRSYRMMGFAAAALDWVEYKDGANRVWLPRVKPWQPQLLYYQQFADADTVDLGALVAITLNQGLVRVDAGQSRWVLFRQSQLKPWLRGAVNTLAEAYLGDASNFRDNMAFQDRFGRGIMKLHHPVSWKDEEILRAASTLRHGGGGGVMPLPTGPRGEKVADLDLVQADGTGFKTFESTDKRVRDRILIALLGQNMTSVGSAGGFAQARVHENGLWRKFEQAAAAFGDAVMTVTEEDEAATPGTFERVRRQWVPRDGVIRSQICRWFSLWNFGDMDIAPYTYWNASAPEVMLEQAGIRLKRPDEG